MPPRVTRIGVIGLGTIGQTHIDAARQMGVHVLGADPSATARERANIPPEWRFADYQEMLADAQLDGVVIATPPRSHREVALQAISANVGVLCEKPLALTLADCEAIRASARQMGRHFQVGFCHRFQPQVRALEKLTSSGALGDVILVDISFTHGLSVEGREWITNRSSAGGGVLFDSGCHAIDLFRYLVGAVDDARALTSATPSTVEDTAVVCLRAGSVLGTIGLSWSTPPWHGSIEVVGTAGRARVDYTDDRVMLRTRRADEPWRFVRTSGVSRFVAQMQHFVACLSGEAAPNRFATADDGVEATRLILRLYSAEAD